MTRWEPAGRRTRGTGSEWDVEMRTLGIPLENRLVIDRWEEPRELGWHSVAGLIRQRGLWTFSRSGAGTVVTLMIAYEPPGAALGNLLAGPADRVVRRRLERALEEMRELLEAEE